MGKRKQVGTPRRPPICVLTIAGSDSGGGAGVQADARAIRALGGHALVAITAVTAQNTRGVDGWRAVPPALIERQIAAVLGDFAVGAVKTGLLPGAAAIRAVARALGRFPRLPLVVDPVIGSTSGTQFLPPSGIGAAKRLLFPLADLITPNWPEAARLARMPVRSAREAAAAAVKILETGCGAVLVKGGHGGGAVCEDILVTRKGLVRRFAGSRIRTRNTHGTGCVLSSAIAAGLARGRTLETAVGNARRLLRKGLRDGRGLAWGEGSGPALA